MTHEEQYRYWKRNRWNHRAPGNGRFPGHGVIRWYAADNIHLAFHTPLVSRRFSSPEAVFEFLTRRLSA